MKRQRGPTNIRSHSAIPMPMEQATSRVSSATAITPKGQRGSSRIIEKVRIETGAAGGERTNNEDHNNRATGRSNNSAGNQFKNTSSGQRNTNPYMNQSKLLQV